jgi:3-hydroxyacyl-CoA dehydrogenase/enoyl-CoA hydratase/3-hydroxybutyryl-CoA epimerase
MPVRLDPGPFDLAAPDVVRRLTRHYGYADDVVADYPAYDAIVRCVVEAADLPLAEGTALEMERFVDLMQNEVAGNMVTSLFLSRQKADKQVAGAASVSSFAVIGSTPAADALRNALAAAKAPLVGADAAGRDIVRIHAGGDRAAADADLHLLETPEDRALGAVGIHIARSRAHGTAIEIVGGAPQSKALGKALALARALRATPYVHPGERSLLATLADIAAQARRAGLPPIAILAAQAAAARRMSAAAGGIGDPAMADVACVVAGMVPAYAGGPFAWLSAHGNELDAIASAHREGLRQLLVQA